MKEVFITIHENLGDNIGFDPKNVSPVELKEKFMLVLPEYDEDSVYLSDMKKVFQWYQLLNDKGVLDFTIEDKKEEKDEKDNKTEE